MANTRTAKPFDAAIETKRFYKDFVYLIRVVSCAASRWRFCSLVFTIITGKMKLFLWWTVLD